MKKSSLFRSFIEKTTSRNKPNANSERVRTRALCLESLESRALLSVAPGSEFLAANAIAAYESGVATRGDILDLSDATLDDAPALRASSIVVTSELDVVDANDGVVTLREALADVQSGDTITFDNSLQGKTIALDSTLGQLEVTQSVTIDASSLWDEANSAPGLTISGQDATRILRVGYNLYVEIKGLALTNGYSNGGGAISNGAELMLENCVLTNNTALGDGGAIFSMGWLTLKNCALTNNTALEDGGAIYNSGEADLNLENCLIVGNAAKCGGGVFADYSATTLRNCTITNNTASHYGGGVSSNGFDIADFRAFNSIIVGNDASAGDDFDFSDPDSEPRAYNTLSSYTSWAYGKNNLTYDASLPLFTDAANGDYTLVIGSQAINKGNNQYVTTDVDLAGNPRISGGTVDLGAYEKIAEAPSTVVTTENDVVDAFDEEISLREALAYAASGDTITFDDSLQGKTIALDSTLGQLEVTQSVTIDASSLWDETNSEPGLTISGQGATRILYVNGEFDVEIDGIALTNGCVSGGNGGAILNYNATLSLNNCALTNSYANKEGGAIYSCEGTLSLDNCTICDNQSEYYGGGIYSKCGEMTFVNCVVSNNNASYSGGGLFLGDQNEPINSVAGKLRLVNCDLTGNIAELSGGAIFCNGETLSLDNCMISGNEAGNGGGVVFRGDEATFVNCVVSNNNASSSCGGIYSYCKSLSLVNCEISGNESVREGGGMVFNGSKPETTLTNCIVTNNMSGTSGGAFQVQGINFVLTVTNCLVTGNSSGTYGGGGEFGSYFGGTATFYNCTVADNTATSGGSGFYLKQKAVLNSYDTIIAGNNTSSSDNADVYVSSSSASANAYNSLSSFTDWTSGENNLVYDASLPLFTDAESGDYTLADGSQAINKGNNQYATTDVDLAGNPRISGGTVDLGAYEKIAEAPSTVVTTENDVVDAFDEEISLREALAYAASGDTITFDDSLQGKTIALDSTLGQLTVTQSVAIDASDLWDEANSAPGLTISGQDATRILNVDGEIDVEINGITLSGGRRAIYNSGSTLLISNCVISDNDFSTSGGALYLEGGETTFANCSITGNSTSLGKYGGAIYGDGATALFVNCVISGNSASGTNSSSGGAVYLKGGEATFVNCSITNNSVSSVGLHAKSYGGGVYLTDASVFNAYNTIIASNSAKTNNTTASVSDVYLANADAVANAYNTLSSYSDWTSGGNNLTYDASLPLFTDATSGDYTLAYGSQAINQGNNQYVTTDVDLAGNPRISGGTVDLGAYEKVTETRSTVVTTADDVVDPYDEEISLREALAYAESGDTITFDASLQGKTIALDSALGELTVNQSVTIDASNLWDATASAPGLTISGQDATRILRVIGGTSYSNGSLDVEINVGINGITLTNGYSNDSDGGAISCKGATLSINNCVISDNRATGNGGGVSSTYYSNMTLTNCVVTRNNAAGGNSVGGAVYSETSTLSLDNCLIGDNRATGNGGGVYVNPLQGPTTLVNCTVTNNVGLFGGGVYLNGNAPRFNAYNSIIAGNRGASAGVDFYSGGNSNVRAYHTLSSYTRWSGASNFTYSASQPLFTDAAAGDYTLIRGSQAIDKGDIQYVTASVDLAGNPRISGETVDLGAYEFQKTKLATPANPRETDKTETTITVEWDAVENATGYQVAWKNEGASEYEYVPINAPTTSHTIEGLVGGATVEWKVQALGNGSDYADSDYTTPRSVATLVKLAAPTNSRETGKTETTITVAWDSVENAIGYQLIWKNKNDSSYVSVTLDALTTSCILDDLDCGATYRWRVRALGDNGAYLNSAYCEPQTARISDPVQLDPPSNPSETDKTETSITVAWDAVPNASGYKLLWKNKTDSSYTTIRLDASTTSYELADLDNGATYIWKVRAQGDNGAYLNSSYCAPQTARIVDSVHLDAPSNPSEIDKTETTITVAWDAVENASGYQLIWKNKNDSSYVSVALDALTTSYILDDLDSDATYRWRVRALGDNDAYLNSAYCELQTVRIVEPIKLDTPSNPSEIDKTETTITVAWDAVENASGYQLIWKNKNDSSYVSVALDALTTSYILDDLDSDATYRWRVRALGDNDAYLNSAYCELQTVKPQQPEAPTSSALLDPSGEAEFFDELDEEDYDLLAVNFIA